jgi:hypothetical protein
MDSVKIPVYASAMQTRAGMMHGVTRARLCEVALGAGLVWLAFTDKPQQPSPTEDTAQIVR